MAMTASLVDMSVPGFLAKLPTARLMPTSSRSVNYALPGIWNTIWSRPYSNYEKHHRVFWDEIRNRVSGRVADLGCGSASCWCIPSPMLDIDLFGFDFSATAITEAKKNCPWGVFIQSKVTEIPVEDSLFDYTVLCGVVNYYHDLKPILDEAKRITKITGHIILTVNVIDDFPDRHWDEGEIEKQFAGYGSYQAIFYPKIGWMIDIVVS